MINWQFFPKSKVIPEHLTKIISIFVEKENFISSKEYKFNSNEILEKIRIGLEKLLFKVEKSKKGIYKIQVPVLFDKNGTLEKFFHVDAYNEISRTVLEVEAGRAVTNYQFLKDLFQACMMYDVDYLVIAVRNDYRGNPDFEKVITFFDTLYASGRLRLPLSGILIIGY